MMITVNTVSKACWTLKGQLIKIDKKQTNCQTTACVAAISQANGVEHVSFFKRSVNTDKFIQFLEELSEKCQDRKICIFFD